MAEDALLELQNVSLRLKFLMKAHDDMLENYINGIKMKDDVKAVEYHTQLENVNAHIDKTLGKVARLESKIAPKDMNDGNLTETRNTLTGMKRKLKTDREKMSALRRKLKNAEGVNANAALEKNSLRIKYLLVCALMVIVIILTIRAFMFQPSMIDMIFVIVALVLGAFHFFNKQV